MIYINIVTCNRHPEQSFEKCSVKLNMDIKDGVCNAPEDYPECTTFKVYAFMVSKVDMLPLDF